MPVVGTCATCKRPLEAPYTPIGTAFCSEECVELAAEGYWVEIYSNSQTVVHHGPVEFPAKGPDRPKAGERMRDFILRYLARASR